MDKWEFPKLDSRHARVDGYSYDHRRGLVAFTLLYNEQLNRPAGAREPSGCSFSAIKIRPNLDVCCSASKCARWLCAYVQRRDKLKYYLYFSFVS